MHSTAQPKPITLHAADDMLLDKVTTRLLTSIGDLSAAEVHSMVTSLGALSSPSIALADVRRRHWHACQTPLFALHTWSAQGVHLVGPTRLLVQYAVGLTNVLLSLQALQERAEELSGDLSAQQKQELADAFSKLGYSDLAAKQAKA